MTEPSTSKPLVEPAILYPSLIAVVILCGALLDEDSLGDALFGPLRGHPRFEALVHEMAGAWVERLSTREGLSQTELLGLVAAHQVRGEYRDARRAILHALELGGPFDEAFRDMLRRLPRSEAR